MRLLTQIDPEGAVTFVVVGSFDAPCVADFDRTLEAARRLRKQIHVDLSHLTGVDCSSLHYLSELAERGVSFVGYPPHVWRWINEVEHRST